MPPLNPQKAAEEIISASTDPGFEKRYVYRSICTDEEDLRWYSGYENAYLVLEQLLVLSRRLPASSPLLDDLPIMVKASVINTKAKHGPRNEKKFAVMFRDIANLLPMRHNAEALSACVPIATSRVFPYLLLSTRPKAAEASVVNLYKLCSVFINGVYNAMQQPDISPSVVVFIYKMSTRTSHRYLMHFFGRNFAVDMTTLQKVVDGIELLKFDLISVDTRLDNTHASVPFPFRPINDGRTNQPAETADATVVNNAFLPLTSAIFTALSGFGEAQEISNFASESEDFFLRRKPFAPSKLITESYKAACIVHSYTEIDPDVTQPVVHSRNHDDSVETQRKRAARAIIESMVHSDTVAHPGMFRWHNLQALDVRVVLNPDNAFVQILNFHFCPVCQTTHPDTPTAFHASTYGLTFRCYQNVSDVEPVSVVDNDGVPPFDVPRDYRDGHFFPFGPTFQLPPIGQNSHVWGELGPMLSFAWAYASPDSTPAYAVPSEEYMSKRNRVAFGPLSVHGTYKTLPTDAISTPFHDVVIANQKLLHFTVPDRSKRQIIESLIEIREVKLRRRPIQKPREPKHHFTSATVAETVDMWNRGDLPPVAQSSSQEEDVTADIDLFAALFESESNSSSGDDDEDMPQRPSRKRDRS